MTTVANLAASPVTAESVHSWLRRPGLYAVYGSAQVWRTTQLGDPPDARPLCVGEAERSLSSRDIGKHFGLSREQDVALSDWMRGNLVTTCCDAVAADL